jgi:anti-anti-sigma regulatory factor
MTRELSSNQVLILNVTGELDETLTRRIVSDVSRHATHETTLIVVSLAGATKVRWNALCSLGRAAESWRTAFRGVVVRGTRPSLCAVLATVDGIGS